jgi:hypothetical protein
MSATKPVAKKKRPPETAERRQVVETVETTMIDVIEEPAPGLVVATEYESVRTATSISPGGEPQRGEGTGPAGTVHIGPDQGERPDHEVVPSKRALMPKGRPR